jgi:hypothetical protein
MRKFKRFIHKQFGGVGNFFAMIILVAITVIFINTYVLSKRESEELPTESPPRIEIVPKSNLTEKPIKQEPNAPQRIQRPVTPDPGRRYNLYKKKF